MEASVNDPLTPYAIARGRVWHQRLQPFTYSFDYPLWMVWCDLEKIDAMLGRHWAWGRRWRPVTFRDQDYLDTRAVPLAEKVREKALSLGLNWSHGRTVMLAQWRTFGTLFNPLVLYLHFPQGKSQPDSMIAEVQNTPWRERHFYPLTFSRNENGVLLVNHPKAFHVSPFLPMLLQYHWHLHVALPDLRIGLEDRDKQVCVFKAGMKLQLVAPDSAAMGKGIFRFGAQGLATLKNIYWQAFKLWRKGAVFHGHPAGENAQRDDGDSGDDGNRE
ncbi:MAG: hypothetical protein AOY29_00405 [Alcanivorax borkumensis]|jgi:DUF1365 family protein|nr:MULTISPECIES: DUF1365 domain-containing protein [Alcanivorax]EUC69777.1 hypothetical protein Y017_12740 [Alcanivorax sp. 97CO-5]OJH08547.1 MAG: hypothetical protein AOY29_00405 [Alcanivorax borkumensis]PKG01617.1 DUF1365 domain-containing protein [Alcanivorax sp. 97CO-6]